MGPTLALAVLLTPTIEDAAAAEERMKEAVQLHADGRLEEASDALADAFRLYPDRDYLFARGVVERETGDCETATDLFEQFLDRHPPIDDVRAAEAELRKCEAAGKPDSEPPPPAVPSEKPVVAAQPEEPPPPRPPRDNGRRWQRDRLGGAFVGSGAALAVVGGGLLIGASVRARNADDADTTGDYRRSFEVARSLNAAGIAVLTVGGALLIAGIVRYALVARGR